MNPTLLSDERKSSAAATPVTTQWNVLLHGLYVLQLAPGGDASKIRIVLPYVNSAQHPHVYETGHSAPWSALAPGENNLWFDYQPAKPPVVSPNDTDKIVVPAKPIPAGAPLNQLSAGSPVPPEVYCWIDAPMPDQIVPLRASPNPVGTPCEWRFKGTIGSGIKANQLPFLVALVYKNVDSTL